MLRRLIGSEGERYAASYLRKNKYKIIETNFSSRFGEIDIIAKHKDTVVFIEVKKRKDDQYGGGAAAVTPAKQRKIILTAAEYMQRNSIQSAVRFDVIEIIDKTINHIVNAFGAGGFL